MKTLYRALGAAGLLAAAVGLIAATAVSPIQTATCAAGQFFNALDATGLLACGTPSSAAENIAYNGAFQFDQVREGASVAVPNGGNGTPLQDGWRLQQSSVNIGATTVQRSTDAPPGASYSSLVTVTTGVATTAGDYLRYFQPVPADTIALLGYSSTGAQPTYLSWWIKSSLGGSWSVVFRMQANTRVLTGSCTTSGANAWTKCGMAIPGDTGAGWTITGQAKAGQIEFWLNASTQTGSTPGVWSTFVSKTVPTGITQANLLETTGATFQIGEVKWELGTVPTAFSVPDYALELKRLQRFYLKTFPQGTAPAQNAGVLGALCTAAASTTAGTFSNYWSFPVEMWSAPTITTFNPSAANANWRDVGGASDAVVLVDPVTGKSATGVMLGEQTTAPTAAHNYCIPAVADARI